MSEPKHKFQRICLVFDSSQRNFQCELSVCVLVNADFRFNERDIGFTGVHEQNHTDRNMNKAKISSEKHESSKQTLFCVFDSITFEFNLPERKKQNRTTKNHFPLYIIRHTFPSTRQIK